MIPCNMHTSEVSNLTEQKMRLPHSALSIFHLTARSHSRFFAIDRVRGRSSSDLHINDEKTHRRSNGKTSVLPDGVNYGV